jgi:hypothetical protein
LAIKSFTKAIVALIIASQGEDDKQLLFSNMLQVFYAKRTTRRDSRQVDIALYLQEFSKPFVDGELSEEEFRQKCETEAISVMGSTPFPLFVRSLGDALYWEGRGSYHSPLDLPLWTMAWTREMLQGGQNRYWYARNLVATVQTARASYEEATRTIQEENPRLDPEEQQKLANQKLVELLLPSLTGFVWKYNQNDIASVVKGACWKLLHSRTHKSSKHRRRQANALMILGKEFARQTTTATKEDDDVCQKKEDEDVCQNKSSSPFASGDEYMDFQARFEVALQMATTSVRI